MLWNLNMMQYHICVRVRTHYILVRCVSCLCWSDAASCNVLIAFYINESSTRWPLSWCTVHLPLISVLVRWMRDHRFHLHNFNETRQTTIILPGKEDVYSFEAAVRDRNCDMDFNISDLKRYLKVFTKW